MPQIILLTGTLLASSVGTALGALILRNAIRNAWRRVKVAERRTAEFIGDADLDVRSRDLAVRGYDTPELAWEDIRMRTRLLH